MPTVREAKAWGNELLAKVGCETPGLDVDVLLAHTAGWTRLQTITRDLEEMPESAWTNFQSVILRRAAGEPVAYLTGVKEFYGRQFRVSPAVLVPRPETEMLVDEVIDYATTRQSGDPLSVIDCGTGSGCIIVSIVAELEQRGLSYHAMALDKSTAALAVARQNAALHGVANISFLQSDWYDALPPGRDFDIIVSNPPYIAPGDPDVSPETRFEPRDALYAGNEGLHDILQLVCGLPERLRPGGVFLCEIGHLQYDHLTPFLPRWPHFARHDLAGLPRVLRIERPSTR